MTKQLLLALFILLPGALVLSAQNVPPELVTDRPDQTESATIVPVGSLQVETGIVYEHDSPGDETDVKSVENIGVATTLVRVGLLKRLELHLIGQYSREKVMFRTGLSRIDEGLDEVAVGVKVKIAEEEGWIPDMALNLHTHLLVGAEAFRPRSAVPDFGFLFSHTLSDNISLGYNLGMSYDGENPAGSLEYTLSLGIALPNDFDTFIEVYGNRPPGEHTNILADVGLTYALTPVFQLDISGGTALTPDSPDYFISSGLSIRFFR